MLRILGVGTSPLRMLRLAAVTTLMLSAGTARRAEAMTPIKYSGAVADGKDCGRRHDPPRFAVAAAVVGMADMVAASTAVAVFAAAASIVVENISAASAAVVFTAVVSVPRRPFTAAVIATAACIAMADFIATGSIVPITAIATSTGAIIAAATIPIATIRAAAGSSGPITARAASAAGIAGTIRTAIGGASLRHSGSSQARTRDLEIPGLALARHPGITSELQPILQFPRRRLPAREVLQLPLLEHRRRPAAEARGILNLGLGDDAQRRRATPVLACASPIRSTYSGLLVMRRVLAKPSRGHNVGAAD